MGGFTIEQVAARPDPLLAWKWVVSDSQQLPFGLPSIYVESIDLPFLNIGVGQSILMGGINKHFPGLAEVQSCSMVLYEDDKATTLKWLDTWKSKIADPRTQLRNVPSAYKRNIPVCLHNNAGQTVYRAVLSGMWPVDTSPLSLSGSETGRITISQPFSIDKVLPS